MYSYVCALAVTFRFTNRLANVGSYFFTFGNSVDISNIGADTEPFILAFGSPIICSNIIAYGESNLAAFFDTDFLPFLCAYLEPNINSHLCAFTISYLKANRVAISGALFSTNSLSIFSSKLYAV